MNGNRPLILVADDDPIVQEMYSAALAEKYQVICVDNGEEALEKSREYRPAAIFLDVEMHPGKWNGYETCRQLKTCESISDTPVIFVSGHDGIDDRLRGYDAGGTDYVVKPFGREELLAKLEQLFKFADERDNLKQMADYAGSTAMTAMTSMSEMGCVLEALRNYSGCPDLRAVARTTVNTLAAFGLRGTVQVRSDSQAITLTDDGEATPLEISVITQMSQMERIVQFKTRMAITYPDVSVLIHNMPVQDAERCGRLRDHLAMIVEGAQVRVRAIHIEAESNRRGATLERAACRISEALDEIDQTQRELQVAMRLAAEFLMQRMEEAYASIALSTAQEDYMSSVLESGLNQMLSTQTGISRSQDKLSVIVGELKNISGRP